MLAKNKWYVQFRYKLMNCRFSIDWIEVLLLLFNFQNTLNKIVLICFKPWWLKLKQFRKRTLDLSLSLLVACSDKGFLYACTYIINVFISHKSLSSKLHKLLPITKRWFTLKIKKATCEKNGSLQTRKTNHILTTEKTIITLYIDCPNLTILIEIS